ncbi:pimeloyl-ACP methyl ester esterase BioH [Neisseria montereyensis]|uniref:Pimeloyl-ACP methyl ester esterase BioH n=1 Tax=Neisseria montereyensis TaxID=2973938 RepID=A0ABT2FCQ4_9NEIS|nr:pimeloyl-ACP methyl ester esterase BioH [Neisseria montereyensis]MCS4533932.1 pimeloyl-ACP methyl ester esterase BioH [Neisseria montereyensis]
MSNSVKKVYLIHGWAANRHVFDDLIPRLPESWDIEALNLPGHGDAPFNGSFHITDIADDLAEKIDEPAYLLGWSLGGLVALYTAARHPEKVRALCITTGFAKFQAAPDYPEGIQTSALDKMIELFQQDYYKYIKQFLQLQFLYTKERQPVLETIMPEIAQYGPPSAIKAALDAIIETDIRPLLPDIDIPTLLIFGAKDTIAPPRMGKYLQQHMPHSDLHVIEKSAHAPFLTQPDEFSSLLTTFFEQH